MRARERDELLETLSARFESNMNRHDDLDWTSVHDRLIADTQRLLSLGEMERTGGEPDVIGYDQKTGEVHFVDCSPESPAGRRSLCYDRAGLESRKEHRPANSAVDMAREMKVDLLTEARYRALQNLGEFDTKTSSWILTPPSIRSLGGALFCDRRYGEVFTYHNGAQSYNASRGFRAFLSV
jgi:hypothetical protein